MSRFGLMSPVGRTYRVDPEDALRTKETLKGLGYYTIPPAYGLTPYPDESMFQGIEQFQDDFDLYRDGMMRPDGETVAKLNEVLLRFGSYSDPTDESAPPPTALSEPDSVDSNEAQQAAAPAIPFIIYEIASYFGMAVSAAYAWWLSLSAEDKKKVRDQIGSAVKQGVSDDDIEDECDEMHYKIDIPTCGRSQNQEERPPEPNAMRAPMNDMLLVAMVGLYHR